MFFSCTLYNPTCKKKATNIRLHTGVFLFKDSIVNTEAGVTFWETRIGAERGKPEISAINEFTAVTSERVSTLNSVLCCKEADKATKQTRSVSEKERKHCFDQSFLHLGYVQSSVQRL